MGVWIRKATLFIVMAAMIGGGGYIIDRQLLSHHAIFWRGFFMGGFLLAFGLYVLVDDFVAPLVRRVRTSGQRA